MNSYEHAHSSDPHAGDPKPSYYESMETSVRELLVEKHVIGADEIRRHLEVLDSRKPALGAKVVARAYAYRVESQKTSTASKEALGLTEEGDKHVPRSQPLRTALRQSPNQ